MGEMSNRKDGNNCNASIGTGAMVLFIAMVLIAGIAASVMVQTANKLEMNAMKSGDETRDDVSTGVRIVDIEGQKDDRNLGGTWYNNSIHNMTLTITPRAGTPSIDLAETIIELTNSSAKCIISYIGDATNPNFASSIPSGGVFATSDDQSGKMFDQSAVTFGVIELEDADETCDASNPVINRGDFVMITINLSACFNGLTARTDVWGRVVPEIGSPAFFSYRVPGLGSDTIYDLY